MSLSEHDEETGDLSVQWSEEDAEYLVTCKNWPSLSWLDEDRDKAVAGMKNLIAEVTADLP